MPRQEGPALRRDPLVRPQSVVLAALSAEVVVLALTGIALYFVYRPSDVTAWNGIRTLHPSGSKPFADATRLLHRASALLSLPTALIAGILAALRARSRLRWTGPALGAGLILTALAASFTGSLLPWDQLALWATTVGERFVGYQTLFRGQVRFVLIGGVETTPSAIAHMLILHTALGGPIMAGLLACAWRRGGRTAGAVRADPDVAAGAALPR